ncbi:MAG: hypothetical protein HFJ55_00145 [Clostridia bacterium]|jgi:hypothetical protein|nr:hypothetical protein [Clostridia bacterium]
MHKTITIRTDKFSLTGLLYYRRNKKLFSNRSFATLLTTATEGLIAKLPISVATKYALSQRHIWVKRHNLILNVKPEDELEEGDLVVLWMAMGNIHYKVQNDKLILTEC